MFGRIHYLSHLILGFSLFQESEYQFNLLSCYKSVEILYIFLNQFRSFAYFQKSVISSSVSDLYMQLLTVLSYNLFYLFIYLWFVIILILVICSFLCKSRYKFANFVYLLKEPKFDFIIFLFSISLISAIKLIIFFFLLALSSICSSFSGSSKCKFMLLILRVFFFF